MNITIRTMSGAAITLENVPIRTRIYEITRRISAWMYKMQPMSVKQEYNEQDLDIDLVYEDSVVHDRTTTLDELRMESHEFVAIASVPPPLVSSSSESDCGYISEE